MLGRYSEAAAVLEEAVGYGREPLPDDSLAAAAAQCLAQIQANECAAEQARVLPEAALRILARGKPDAERRAHAVFALGKVQAERLDRPGS